MAQMTLEKALGHLRTITEHKRIVFELMYRCGLPIQGLFHDMSKYSPTEFCVGAQYWCGSRSPNAIERDEKGYTEAWLHHKGRNRHHFEYWVDYTLKERDDGLPAFSDAQKRIFVRPAPMPTRYIVEMFCDRVAACKVYQGETYTDASALEYLQREYKGVLLTMHPDTLAFLEVLLTMLAEQGEGVTLDYIRTNIVEPRFCCGDGARF